MSALELLSELPHSAVSLPGIQGLAQIQPSSVTWAQMSEKIVKLQEKAVRQPVKKKKNKKGVKLQAKTEL